MFKNTVIVTILSLAVSVASFVNQIILAKYFGAGMSMDIYLIYSSIPLMISGLVFAAFSYSLTPHFILQKAVLTGEFNAYVGKLFTRIIKNSFLISITGSLLVIILKRWIYPAGISKSNEGNWIMVFSWLTALITVAVSFMTSYANSVSSFRFPLLVSFSPYVFSILFAVAGHHYIGIISVSLGMFVGSLVSLVLFFIFFYSHAAFRNKHTARTDSFEKKTSDFLKAMPVIMMAMLCFSVYQSIDAYWASKLGDAAMSYLGYCQRIIVAIGTLVIVGPSTILIPRLSKAIAEKRDEDFFSDTALVIKMIISIMSLCSLIGAVCSNEIIQLMFERGAFKRIDTQHVAALLPYMLTGIVFAVSVVMMFRAFFVIGKIKAVAWLGVACALLYFGLSGIGSRVMGLRGIGLAYIATWVIIFICTLYILFKNNFGYILNVRSLRFIVIQLLLLVITGFVIIFTKPFFLSWFSGYGETMKVLLVLVFSGGLGLLTYLVPAMTVLPHYEVAFLVRGFMKKKLVGDDPFKATTNKNNMQELKSTNEF